MTNITDLLDAIGRLSKSPLGTAAILVTSLLLIMTGAFSCHERNVAMNSQWYTDHPDWGNHCKSSTYMTQPQNGSNHTCDNEKHKMVSRITKLNGAEMLVVECICEVDYDDWYLVEESEM